MVVLGGHKVVPGGPRVLPGGCLVVIWPKMNVTNSLRKGFFGPLVGVWGGPPCVMLRNLTPSGARLARKVLWDDNLAPFSSRETDITESDITETDITRKRKLL